MEDFVAAGKTITTLSNDFMDMIKIDADILDFGRYPDKKINEMRGLGYNIMCPTTIDPNNIVHHCAPMGGYLIQPSDVIKYSIYLSKEVDKKKKTYAHVKIADSKAMNKLNDGLVNATREACYAGIKQCGVDVRLLDIRFYVNEILDSYELHTLNNICGNELYNSLKIVPNSKLIPESLRTGYDLINARMAENEVYFIDVYGVDTSNDVSASPIENTSLFYSTGSKVNLGRQSTRLAKEMIDKKYETNIFSLWDARERFQDFAKTKLTSKIMNDLLKAQVIFPVYASIVKDEYEGIMNYVARCGRTVHIGENKTTLLTE